MTRRNMSDQQFDNDEDDTLLLERTRPKLKKPPLFKVILLNDDYTPMEFVVHVLEKEAAKFDQAVDDAEVEKLLRGLGYIE